MLAVHRNAAMTDNANTKKAFPVTSIHVHKWLKRYLGNKSVQWINGNTLIIWNSAAHKKMMGA